MLKPLVKGHLWGTPWTSTLEDIVESAFPSSTISQNKGSIHRNTLEKAVLGTSPINNKMDWQVTQPVTAGLHYLLLISPRCWDDTPKWRLWQWPGPLVEQHRHLSVPDRCSFGRSGAPAIPTGTQWRSSGAGLPRALGNTPTEAF